MILKKILWLAMLLPFAAASANETDYLQKDIKLAYGGQGSVVVATQDVRSYVLSGEKKPEFVGLVRGVFGNPGNVKTKSRNALAEDFTASIVAALANSGFAATGETATGTETSAQVLGRLAGTGPDRIVVVQIRDWKSDTHRKLRLKYDVTISVHDHSGALLDSLTDKAEEEVDGVPQFTSKPYVDPSVRAYRRKLEAWLNDDRLRNALGGAPVAAATGTAAR